MKWFAILQEKGGRYSIHPINSEKAEVPQNIGGTFICKAGVPRGEQVSILRGAVERSMGTPNILKNSIRQQGFPIIDPNDASASGTLAPG